MDRYLLALFGALMMLVSFTSCTDQEEIDITYHHGVVAEVNPYALYEKCGFDWFDLSGDFLGIKTNLEITILVYDKEGSLHQRLDKTVKSLQSFTMDLSDLDEDKYTIIAVQQIVLGIPYDKVDIPSNEEDTPSDEEEALYTYRAWVLENINNIQDVRIISNTSLTSEIPGFLCLGIQTQEVSINKGMSIKIATEPTGSFVDVTYENLEYSEYNWSALCFGDQARGLYLNPELPEQGKYYYEDRELFSDDYWTMVNSYYTDIISIDGMPSFFLTPEKVYYCFKFAYFKEFEDIDTGLLDFFPENPSGAFFEAEKGQHYRACCYYNVDTEEFSIYMGPESEFEQWLDALDKWKTPPFEQPYVKWGASLEEVKQYMTEKNYDLSNEWEDRDDVYYEDEFGNQFWVDENIVYWLTYDGKNLDSSIGYKIDKTEGLIRSSVNFYNDNCSLAEILEVFNTDPLYSKIEGFDEVYLQTGHYVYVNDSVQAEIYQGKLSDGTKYIEIEYSPRSMPN